MATAQNADWTLAQALYLQGLPHAEIAARVQVTEASLRKRASRRKWYQLRTASITAAAQHGLNRTGETLAKRSAQVREALSEEIQDQVSILRSKRPRSPAELRNQPSGEGRASLVKKVAETASIVHDWKTEHAPGILLVSDMRGTAPDLLSMADSAEANSGPVVIDATVSSEPI
jgi:hypothetical protein